jgi:hypothetical protein
VQRITPHVPQDVSWYPADQPPHVIAGIAGDRCIEHWTRLQRLRVSCSEVGLPTDYPPLLRLSVETTPTNIPVSTRTVSREISSLPNSVPLGELTRQRVEELFDPLALAAVASCQSRLPTSIQIADVGLKWPSQGVSDQHPPLSDTASVEGPL